MKLIVMLTRHREMPANCYVCRMGYKCDTYRTALMPDGDREKMPQLMKEERHISCPLIEVDYDN